MAVGMNSSRASAGAQSSDHHESLMGEFHVSPGSFCESNKTEAADGFLEFARARTKAMGTS